MVISVTIITAGLILSCGDDGDTTPSDTDPPDTSINSGPANITNQTSATFVFTSTEAGSTFECQLDGGGYSSCASPKTYGGLSDGSHTFEVRAIDGAGNTDPTPASYTWTIDIPPSETIVLTIGTDPDITFAGAADGVQAFYTAAGSEPIPPASTAVVAIDGSHPDLAISFAGTTADTYTIQSGAAVLSCSDASGNIYAATQGLVNTSGDVIVTEIGAVGERIVGTYSLTANAYDGGGPTTNTVAISGSFNVTRGSDK